MSSDKSQIVVYGTAWCGDTIRSRKFLDANSIPYVWVDINKDPEGRRLVESINNGNRSVPTIIFPDGSTLIEPANSVLAEKLGL